MAQPATFTMLTILSFDYQAELDQISKEVQTTLQAKFDVAIANFQKSIENIDIKVEQKIQHCMEKLHTTQADKATQENHTQQWEQLKPPRNLKQQTIVTSVGLLSTPSDIER